MSWEARMAAQRAAKAEGDAEAKRLADAEKARRQALKDDEKRKKDEAEREFNEAVDQIRTMDGYKQITAFYDSPDFQAALNTIVDGMSGRKSEKNKPKWWMLQGRRNEAAYAVSFRDEFYTNPKIFRRIIAIYNHNDRSDEKRIRMEFEMSDGKPPVYKTMWLHRRNGIEPAWHWADSPEECLDHLAHKIVQSGW